MRFVRVTATGGFAVRVSSGGKQTHCGTFSTYDAAILHRDLELASCEREGAAHKPTKKKTKKKGVGAEGEPRAHKQTGVYPRITFGGTRYEVYKVIKGHTIYGGSYATLKTARDAHAALELDTKRAAMTVPPTEKGITLRYIGRRNQTPRARFVVRLHTHGIDKHIGVFDTIEEARGARRQALMDANP